MRSSRLAREITAYALFLVLAGCLVWPAFLGRVLLPLDYVGVFYPWQAETLGAPSLKEALPWNALLADSVLQYLPWRQFARESLRSGCLPLWNPHQFCGTPFLANYQSALLYPPNVLFWILPAAMAFGVAAGLHLFLAGAFAYLYLRGRGLGRFAAVTGGVSFELCGFIVAWIELPTAVNVVVWLPLALYLYERARGGAGGLRGLPVIFPLAMILLAGHPQFAVYALLGFAAYALAHPPEASGRRQRLLGVLSCALVPLAIAGLLAAPQLLPVLELSRLSHRGGTSLLVPSAEGYTAQALPFWAGVVVLMPGFFGNPGSGNHWGPANYGEFAGYWGVLPALLAAIAVLGWVVPSWRRSWLAALPGGSGRRVAFFAGLAAVALCAAFRNPVGEAVHAVVPAMGRFGSPGRVLCLCCVGVAMLAGYGAEAVSTRRAGIRPVLLAAALLAVAGIGAWLAAVIGVAPRVGVSTADVAAVVAAPGARFLGLVFPGTGVLLLWSRNVLSAGAARLLLVALVAGDLMAASAGLVPAAPPALAYPRTSTAERIRQFGPEARFLALTPRWSLERHPLAILPPNAATACGLNDVNGYDSLYLLSYKSFLNRLAGRDTSPPANGNLVLFDAYRSREFPLLACRYILSLSPLTGDRLALVVDGPVKVYEFQDAYPRTYLSDSASLVPRGEPRATIESITPTRVVVRLDSGRPGTLVLLDAWYPGWRAYTDGGEQRVEPVHGVFRGVPVSANARRVEFRYEPAAFRLGMFLALASLAAIAGAATACRVAATGRGRAPKEESGV